MAEQRELGIVVYGATGYTGKLVAEALHARLGTDGAGSWAMAGRSLEKLEATREDLGIGSELPLLVADASDPASLHAMVQRAQVVLTTVGPYQNYGSELVAACAAFGTDYVDLCGEPTWMAQMIAAHADSARSSGARIVFSCGFDSIPFDLGVFFLQQQAIARSGVAAPRVRGRVRALKGTWSGGTLASFRATMAAVSSDPSLQATLANPFALTPNFTGAEQPTGLEPHYDEVLQSWVAPFLMATINSKNIHRSNFLLGHRYGTDFVYDEMLITGPGAKGEAAANAVAQDRSMAKDQTPPGEGPTREQRENGYYDLLFVGHTVNGELLRSSVAGDRDPGYGSTSKMIVESALCLLDNPELASGGIWTPASALGEVLIERLQKHAGLSFQLGDAAL